MQLGRIVIGFSVEVNYWHRRCAAGDGSGLDPGASLVLDVSLLRTKREPP